MFLIDALVSNERQMNDTVLFFSELCPRKFSLDHDNERKLVSIIYVKCRKPPKSTHFHLEWIYESPILTIRSNRNYRPYWIICCYESSHLVAHLNAYINITHSVSGFISMAHAHTTPRIHSQSPCCRAGFWMVTWYSIRSIKCLCLALLNRIQTGL